MKDKKKWSEGKENSKRLRSKENWKATETKRKIWQILFSLNVWNLNGNNCKHFLIKISIKNETCTCAKLQLSCYFYDTLNHYAWVLGPSDVTQIMELLVRLNRLIHQSGSKISQLSHWSIRNWPIIEWFLRYPYVIYFPFVIQFYLQPVLARANCIKTYTVACRRVLSSAPLYFISSKPLVALGNKTYKLNLKS
jgi:hypothetical protein